LLALQIYNLALQDAAPLNRYRVNSGRMSLSTCLPRHVARRVIAMRNFNPADALAQ
jgi:hypothetical protein